MIECITPILRAENLEPRIFGDIEERPVGVFAAYLRRRVHYTFAARLELEPGCEGVGELPARFADFPETSRKLVVGALRGFFFAVASRASNSSAARVAEVDPPVRGAWASVDRHFSSK